MQLFYFTGSLAGFIVLKIFQIIKMTIAKQSFYYLTFVNMILCFLLVRLKLLDHLVKYLILFEF